MPSTYSTSLRLELMADGEKSGTWGTITNTNLGTLIEQGVAGVASVAHDDSASYTLTTNNGSSDEARNAVVLMTGALTADREVIVPDVDKVYIFKNGTSGGFALTFKTSGGTGVTIPNGRAAICYVDSGTGTVNAIDDGYFTDSIYIEGSSAGDFITAESTNAGATSGPDIKLYRNSASPADSDVLSKITFTANTDNGAGGVSVSDVEYASINVSAPETNETSGEAGKMVIALKRGGTTQNYIEIQGGTSADADNDSIVFKTGGSTAMTIDNSQNVIIANDLSVDTNTLYVDSSDNVTIAGNDTANYSTNYARGQFAAVSPSSYAAISISAHDTASGNGSFLGFMRSRGTYASPSYVQAGDLIGDISSQAYDFVGGADRYTSSARITFTASENHTATAAGTDITFLSTEDTTKTQYERLSLESDLTVFNEDSRDVDFRVESNANTHMLFVDAGADQVRIGQSSSSVSSSVAKLYVQDGVTTDYSGQFALSYQAGTYTDYYKGMTGIDLSSSVARGLHLFNYDNDSDAGINFWSGRPTVGTPVIMATFGPSNTIFNDGGEDRDFRVESDNNANMLYVDAGDNRVGVGTSGLGTGATFEVNGTMTVEDTSDNDTLLRVKGGTQNLYIQAGSGYGGVLLSANQYVSQEYRTNEADIMFSIDNGATKHLHIDFAGTSQISTNGIKFTHNEGGGDYDFRVESDNQSHMLFVDAGNDRVGIGSNTLSASLQVGYVPPTVGNQALAVAGQKSSYVTSSYSLWQNQLVVYDTNSSAAAGVGGAISFAADCGSGNNTWLATAEGYKINSTAADYSGGFIVRTRVNGDATMHERMRLNETEAVFNESSRNTDFRVESDGNANMLFVDASANKVIVGGTSYYGGTPAIFGVNGHMDIGTTSGNAWSLAFAASQTVGSMGTVTSKISGFSTMSAIQFYANNVTGGSQAASINFYTTNSATQRNTGRFINEGAFQVSNDGTYRTWSGNITGNQFVNNQQSMVTLTSDATSTAFDATVIRSLCNRSQNSGYSFLTCTSGNLGDDEFRLRGDGQAYADGSWNGGGADYAEYFETTTGSAIPRGTTVVLEGNKVRAATADDPASAVIGVIRPKEDGKISAMVGNTAWARWSEKYLTDDFGVYLMEDHNVIEWEEEYLDDEGETRKKSHSYESHNIPDGITVPSDATIKTHDDDGVKFQHRQLNPDYDPNLEYVSREDRDEWVIVGLLGQVRILSGQPVGERWTKMKDISATVEEWFIR